jgi:hypothetical protein
MFFLASRLGVNDRGQFRVKFSNGFVPYKHATFSLSQLSLGSTKTSIDHVNNEMT